MGIIGACQLSQVPFSALVTKYKVEPSGETRAHVSNAGLLILGPRFTGGPQGSEGLARLAIHMS